MKSLRPTTDDIGVAIRDFVADNDITAEADPEGSPRFHVEFDTTDFSNLVAIVTDSETNDVYRFAVIVVAQG